MTAWVLTWLLNAFWQAPLLLLAAWAAAPLLRRLGPIAEYRVWVTALLLQMTLPACPGLRVSLWPFGSRLNEASGIVAVVQGPASAHVGLVLVPWLAKLLLLSYAGVLAVLGASFIQSVWAVFRLRRQAVPVSSFACECGTAVPVAESKAISTPMTLGFRHPVVLLPAGLARRLTPVQSDALLAHERAHIVRRDFATNLLLRAFVLPLGWHPCTRIALTRLAAAREIVCDKLAVEFLNTLPHPESPTRYARSLLEMASLLARQPQTVPALVIGFFAANTLERRIMSLTHPSARPSLLRRTLLVTAAALLACCTCTAAVALHTSLTPGDPVKVGGGIMAGHIRSKVAPVYPQAAKEARVQGTVLLHAVIGKDGTVQDLSVLSGPPELTASALQAVQQWTYEPFLLNGEPTEVETTITINYTLAP